MKEWTEYSSFVMKVNFNNICFWSWKKRDMVFLLPGVRVDMGTFVWISRTRVTFRISSDV